MIFSHPLPLILALFICPSGIAFLIWRERVRRQALEALTSESLVQRLDSPASKRRRWSSQALAILALFAILFALSRPVFGSLALPQLNGGTSLVFLVDVSRSMDVRDTLPSRLERARIDLMAFVQRAPSVPISIVAFAQDAVIILPLTNDRRSIEQSLAALKTQIISNQGTYIASGLARAKEALSIRETDRAMMILVTDGEDQSGLAATEIAAFAEGAELIILMYGTDTGGPVPDSTLGAESGSVLRDTSGDVVYSRSNSALAEELASDANGLLLYGNSSDNVNGLLTALDSRAAPAAAQDKSGVDRFAIFLLLAWFALALDLLIGDTGKRLYA
jgi:Ca-activated chloride channel homolog